MLSSSAFSPPPPRELAGGMSGKAARNAPPPSPPIVVTERDIVFDCPNCAGELVIDREGVGLTLACSHCGKSVTVPERSQVTRATGSTEGAPAAPTFNFEGQTAEQISQRADELKRQLTENHSQTTEMRGHVSRGTIELHRNQLKLQKLLDRQAAIEAEMTAAKAALEPSS